MGLFSKREKADGFTGGGTGVTVVTGGAAAFVPAAPSAPGGPAAATPVPRAGEGRADEIATVDDLPEFVRTLYDELDMAPSLRHVICPVLVEAAASADGRGRFALILTRDMANSDVTEEILRQLRLRFDPAAPAMYLAAAQVMVALSRGSVEPTGGGDRLAVGAGRRPASALWQNFDAVGRFALREGASDLHWEVEDQGGYSQVRLAIDGYLVAPPEFRMETGVVLDTLSHVWQKGKGGSQGVFSRVLPQQTSIRAKIDGQPVVFRWASMQSATGHVTVMRMHREEVTSKRVDFVDDLGYFEQQAQLLDRNTMQLGGGTVLVGVVGSGKTTTAHAIMQRLPAWMNKMAIEDPVELLAEGTHHFSVSRTLDGTNRDEDPFIAAKRQIKRMNPHFVMVGELRDHESAGLFRDVAGAGLRALTTVHAPSALTAPDRLSDGELRIPRSVLATPGFVNLYVYQALLPKTCTCGLCGADMKRMLGADRLSQIERLFQFDVEGIRLRNPQGCDLCRRPNLPDLNGARGRTVVAEMFEPDELDLSFIRDAKNIELAAYQRSKRRLGFDVPDSTGKTVFEVTMYKVFAGIVDPREAEKLTSLDAYEARRQRELARATNAMGIHA
ncbi:Flp pilus assembly complex ATPase component TadA (plasmid) [Cupriavidus sp. KK10]|jgi:type II secretory ATPase GspE/PulE/Tfp pilus assembly ATPase PilB-like protein|uniref:ATPase, T2SS/T4P/T4SS family n=1 Tax=Cupriavidus sp. KK10 TaxID=1478019 RepID=UPI001BA8E667|nr:ATPase, T2SS/T4P/T4SS family [Cupriavidus sp. KK10]QUN31803.1 Flp pilus assembly complex ATPase component TadA [Cupriavidus sp. KK10]